MNSELKDRVFEIPKDILDTIDKTYTSLKGKDIKGIDRAETLLFDKKVNYGQLKRIIHDLEKIDKIKYKTTYELYGGNKMLYWGKQFLNSERDLIKNRKKSKQKANDISGLNGIRRNSFNSKHSKKLGFKIPLNLVKSNSDKTSVSSLGLFEEINKIKNLINY